MKYLLLTLIFLIGACSTSERLTNSPGNNFSNSYIPGAQAPGVNLPESVLKDWSNILSGKTIKVYVNNTSDGFTYKFTDGKLIVQETSWDMDLKIYDSNNCSVNFGNGTVYLKLVKYTDYYELRSELNDYIFYFN